MTFERDKLVKKPKEVKAIYTNNGKESERKQPVSKSDKPFYERMGIWGYTLTTGGVGIGIGVLFGAFAYSLMATTDEKLVEDVKFYKEQYRIVGHEKDSLEAENELLISEREALQERLNEMQKDYNSLEQSFKIVNAEINQYKDLESANSNSIGEKESTTSVVKVNNTEKKEVNLNESVPFFEDKINVAAFAVDSYSTHIQIGASGFDSEKHYSANVGDQFDYESDSKYQIRVLQINKRQNKIVIQVTEF